MVIEIRLPASIRELMREIQPDAPISDRAIQQYTIGVLTAAVSCMGPTGHRVAHAIRDLNEDTDVLVGDLNL